jgi:uncharacterized protein (DUF58 family)
MLSQEILARIKKLQLHTKRMLNSNRLGDYRSSKRGYGLEFDQIRSYELGDDVRFIDWKSSSRMNQLLVKQYLHECNKTVIIALDTSASLQYGSGKTLKDERAKEVATVLAFAALYGKASLGLILFSDEVEKFIPPKQGQPHAQMIVDTIWQHVPTHKKTSLKNPLQRLAQLKRSDSLAFLVSDFIDQYDYERELSYVSRLYDLVAIRCLDECEKVIPFSGTIEVIDPESNQSAVLDLGSDALQRLMKDRLAQQNKFFIGHGVDHFDCSPNDSFIDALIGFFSVRLKRI